jgi:Type II secretion system (T2SS), protein E, N-terminal domain
VKAPDALATLLVRDGLLPQPRVDEANERTVLLGGRLDTALLELGLLDEATLTPLLARAYGAPTATRDAILKADRALAHVFPRRLSEKHDVVPLEVSGRRLSVAVAGKPDLSLLDEIGFMLSVYVKAIVVPEARLAWARARLYGSDVPARLGALLRQLGEHDVALKPNESWTAKSAAEKAHKPERPAEPAAAAAPDASGWSVSRHVGLDRSAPSAPDVTHASGGSVAAEREAKKARSAQPSAEERRRTERVQWTVDDAIAELALADERDAMLDVVLRFAYRRLTTAAIFIVHTSQRADGTRHSELIGWDLIDPLLTKNDIGTFALPATGEHALAQVVQMQSPFLGPLKDGDPLARLIGRKPRAAVLVPIHVGDKVAGVLYGDAGTRSIPPSTLAELHMVVPRLGKGLKNLILRKKKALRQSQELPPDIVVVGTLVDSQAPTDAEPEETIAVSPVQRVTRPTLEIDIVELEEAKALEEARAAVSLDAPSSLSSQSFVLPPPAVPGAAPAEASAPAAPVQAAPSQESPLEAPAGLAIEVGAQPMPWADGAGDDEDVRLDASSVAELNAPPRKITQRMRLEMPELAAPVEPPPETMSAAPAVAWADGGSDDEDVKLDAVSLHALNEKSQGRGVSAPLMMGSLDVTDALASIPDGAPLDDGATVQSSLPDGAAIMPAPDLLAAAASPATADSPGASARESLLLATWQDWLRHDDDALDQVVGELQLKQDGSRAEKQALSALVAHGARAMPSLARYFPGALSVHPFGAMPRRPEVEELSDCTSCLVTLGADLAAPILVGELTHEDRLHRWTAVWCLSRLRVPGAVARLGERVLDPEPVIAALAREVLDSYRGTEGFTRVLARLRDLLKRGDAFERARALDAVLELRDRGALEALTDLLGTKPKELADAARRALVEITKQDFGNAERRWRAWIADNESQPRVRWLIEGLSHKDEEIRRSAQLELNRMTGQYFGYRYDASRAEREQGLQAWQEWWTTQEREAPGRWL